MNNPSNIIQTLNLCKNYKNIKAINNLNLKIKKGEVFGLLGPNGAGKSTFIHILCTILKPSSGTAQINGYDIIKEPDKVRKSIGIVFQDPSIDDELTAYENMEFHAMIYNVTAARDDILKLLRMVDLEVRADDFVKTFSGGMRRRLEIARGLLHRPEILFLDEPTIGLDTQTRRRIWEYLSGVVNENEITIILTTHYLEEADNVCDRIAIIDEGKIKAIGTPGELKRNLNNYKIILKLIEKENHILESESFMQDIITAITKKIKTKIDITNTNITKNNSELKIEIVLKINNLQDDFDESLFETLVIIRDTLKEFEGIFIKEIDLQKPTMDDVFIHHTGKNIRDELEHESHRRLRKVARRRNAGVVMR